MNEIWIYYIRHHCHVTYGLSCVTSPSSTIPLQRPQGTESVHHIESWRKRQVIRGLFAYHVIYSDILLFCCTDFSHTAQQAYSAAISFINALHRQLNACLKSVKLDEPTQVYKNQGWKPLETTGLYFFFNVAQRRLMFLMLFSLQQLRYVHCAKYWSKKVLVLRTLLLLSEAPKHPDVAHGNNITKAKGSEGGTYLCHH